MILRLFHKKTKSRRLRLVKLKIYLKIFFGGSEWTLGCDGKYNQIGVRLVACDRVFLEGREGSCILKKDMNGKTKEWAIRSLEYVSLLEGHLPVVPHLDARWTITRTLLRSKQPERISHDLHLKLLRIKLSKIHSFIRILIQDMSKTYRGNYHKNIYNQMWWIVLLERSCQSQVRPVPPPCIS